MVSLAVTTMLNDERIPRMTAPQLAAFASAFCLGILASFLPALVSSSTERILDKYVGDSEYITAKGVESPNQRILVEFDGYHVEDDDFFIRFQVTNLTGRSAIFSSHGHWLTREPRIEVNGENVPWFRCGTWMTDQELRPHESMEARVYRWLPATGIEGKEGHFRVGYYFDFAGVGNRLYWSDPIPITDELRRLIREDEERDS